MSNIISALLLRLGSVAAHQCRCPEGTRCNLYCWESFIQDEKMYTVALWKLEQSVYFPRKRALNCQMSSLIRISQTPTYKYGFLNHTS